MDYSSPLLTERRAKRGCIETISTVLPAISISICTLSCSAFMWLIYVSTKDILSGVLKNITINIK